MRIAETTIPIAIVQVEQSNRSIFSDNAVDEWTLQSGFDGDELFARPSIEFITAGPEVIHRAEELTESCEHVIPAMPRFHSIGFWPKSSGGTVLSSSSWPNQRDARIADTRSRRTLTSRLYDH